MPYNVFDIDGSKRDISTTGKDKNVYRYIVGNTAEGDTLDVCDFLDSDGIYDAVSTVITEGGGDIFIRQGTYQNVPQLPDIEGIVSITGTFNTVLEPVSTYPFIHLPFGGVVANELYLDNININPQVTPTSGTEIIKVSDFCLFNILSVNLENLTDPGTLTSAVYGNDDSFMVLKRVIVIADPGNPLLMKGFRFEGFATTVNDIFVAGLLDHGVHVDAAGAISIIGGLAFQCKVGLHILGAEAFSVVGFRSMFNIDQGFLIEFPADYGSISNSLSGFNGLDGFDIVANFTSLTGCRAIFNGGNGFHLYSSPNGDNIVDDCIATGNGGFGALDEGTENYWGINSLESNVSGTLDTTGATDPRIVALVP